jgi:hypothetical protein
MRVIFRVVILGFVLLTVMNYVSYQQTAHIPARDWLASAESWFNKLIHKNSSSETATVKVSKWTDAKGVVHYENRPVDGAKTIEVDANTNVLPPAPLVKLPKVKEEKPKTMNDELRDIQEAKKAHFDALTQ